MLETIASPPGQVTDDRSLQGRTKGTAATSGPPPFSCRKSSPMPPTGAPGMAAPPDEAPKAAEAEPGRREQGPDGRPCGTQRRRLPVGRVARFPVPLVSLRLEPG